ncbi:MAG: sulfite exporter TauE/SafE family protein [Clostridia bacterium]|nr:sulfite exporter TauE/SafE family protein [Clostridia bacterium]
MKFYELLSILNQAINEPLMTVTKSSTIPILTAFLIGILGSTAPCQITTNLGAIGFLTKESTNKRKLLNNTLWYTLGKIIVFMFFGLLISVFSLEIQKISIPLFSFVRRFMGLFVAFIGLYIIGVFKLNGLIGNTIVGKSQSIVRRFNLLPPSFIMGVIFSLAFCPTLFWLFFGLVIPLSIKSSFGFILPVFFALGTLAPLAIVVPLISLGRGRINENLKIYRKFQKVLRVIGGTILVLIGALDSLVYWFS